MIKYIYENHVSGNYYCSDKELDYDELYCEECGDSDGYVGSIDTEHVSVNDFFGAINHSYVNYESCLDILDLYIELGIDAQLVKAFRDLMDDRRKEHFHKPELLDKTDPGDYYYRCIQKQKEKEVEAKGNKVTCPSCNHWLATISDVDDWGILCTDGGVYDYCPYCGQKLDWDGEKIGQEVDKHYAKTKRTEVD